MSKNKTSTKSQMRRFELHRKDDISGLSGTGVVAEGIEFSNGMCAVTWRSMWRTVTTHESVKTVTAVHGHNGATKIVWVDPV